MARFHKIGLSFTAVILASCAIAPQPPPPATDTQIAVRWVALQALNLDPPTYTALGYAIDDAQCHAWLDALVVGRGVAGFLGAQGALAATAAGMAGVAASTPIGAAVAGAAGLASATLSNATAAGGIPYPTQTAALVDGAISAYETEAPPASVTNMAQAIKLVDGHWWQTCSLTKVQQLSQQAIVTAVPVTASSPVVAPSIPQTVVGEVSPLTSRARIRARIQQSPHSADQPTIVPSSVTLRPECYMTVMGCRVAIPQVMIGGH